MPNLKLIINADDAGIDHARNEGIIEAFERGVVRSATALVNGKAFDEIVSYAKGHPSFGLGLHFNLTGGCPVGGEGSSLCSEKNFYPKRKAWALAHAGSLDSKAIASEFQAQIKRFLETGLIPTHIDGHNHIHVFPMALDSCLDVIKDYPQVHRIRLPLESASELEGPTPDDGVPALSEVGQSEAVRKFQTSGHPKAAFFRCLAENAIQRLPSKWYYPGNFAGICLAEQFTLANFMKSIRSFNSTSAEIMTHPGYCDSQSVFFSARPEREKELEVLTSQELKDWIALKKITLINYRTLNP